MMKTLAMVFVLFGAAWCLGQEVHTSAVKGGIVLSVAAQKPYEIMSSEKKTPILAVQCSLKGKKPMHVVTFTVGGSMGQDNPENAPKNGEISLVVTFDGTKHTTEWIPWTDPITFAYYGKTEPERIQFLQEMLSSPTISIEFTPFLTGSPVTTTFDLTQLKQEVNQHPECAGIKSYP